MSGEHQVAEEMVAKAMAAAAADPKQDRDSMGRALIHAVLTELLKHRTASDIAAEVHYLIDSLDEDEFVITRGC